MGKILVFGEILFIFRIDYFADLFAFEKFILV